MRRLFTIIPVVAALATACSTPIAVIEQQETDAPAVQVNGEILFVKDRSKLSILTTPGGEERALPVGEVYRIHWPMFSQDGSRIAYVEQNKLEATGGERRLKVLDPATETSYDLGRIEDIATAVRPYWTRDGARIYVRGDSLPVVIDVPEDARPERAVPGEVVTRAVITNGHNLYLYDVVKRTRQQITQLPVGHRPSILATDHNPEWNKFAFGFGTYLMLVEAGNQDAKALHEADSDIYWIEWHPDGGHIYFLVGPPYSSVTTTRQLGSATLFSYEMESGIVTPLFKDIKGNILDVHPALSSDGRFIAVESEVKTWKRLFGVSTAGDGVLQLNDKGVVAYPYWRPTR